MAAGPVEAVVEFLDYDALDSEPEMISYNSVISA